MPLKDSLYHHHQILVPTLLGWIRIATTRSIYPLDLTEIQSYLNPIYVVHWNMLHKKVHKSPFSGLFKGKFSSAKTNKRWKQYSVLYLPQTWLFESMTQLQLPVKCPTQNSFALTWDVKKSIKSIPTMPTLTSLSFMANMMPLACSAAFPTIGRRITLINATGIFNATDAPC